MRKPLLALALPFCLSLSALATTAHAQGVPHVRIPLPEFGTMAASTPPELPISVTLRAATAPAATVGALYSFDLTEWLTIEGGSGSYSLDDVAWSLRAGDVLPEGLTLANGRISGTPTVKNASGAPFEVTGTYQDASGRQIYVIVVNGAVMHATHIASGTEHVCALTTAGGVKCWGNDDSGILGDGGANVSQPTPVDVVGLGSEVVSLSASGFNTCAVTATGGLFCWGYGEEGQLGSGVSTDQSTPVSVSGLSSGVSKVAVGYGHVCALTTAGGVKCWGYNYSGQLGNGTFEYALDEPADVLGLSSGVIDIAAGSNHTCAITTTGGVKCWGDNFSGQLGDGESETEQATPVDVLGLTSGVTHVSAGGDFACAIQAGAAKCWGVNGVGQLGDGTVTDKTAPVMVSGLASGVTQLDAGGGHACAVHNGAAKCWGFGLLGQLGNASAGFINPAPLEVSGLSSGVSQITLGGYHACALTTSSEVKCWGSDSSGQLGDSVEKTNQPAPVDVLP